jgi:hypothetical protein
MDERETWMESGVRAQAGIDPLCARLRQPSVHAHTNPNPSTRSYLDPLQLQLAQAAPGGGRDGRQAAARARGRVTAPLLAPDARGRGGRLPLFLLFLFDE